MYKKVFIICSILALTVLLHFYNRNLIGRATDEAYYVGQGYTIYTLLGSKNFASSHWYDSPDPPIVSKYIYGLGAHFDYVTTGTIYTFHFDFTHTRVISLVFSLLSVLVVILLGWRYISFLTGCIAGLILTTLPYFLGLTQLVSMESLLVFFFTLTVFSYLYYFERPTYKRLVLAGIGTGICFFLKYTNIMLLPLFCCFYFIFTPFTIEKKSMIVFLKRVLLFSFTVLLTCFILWPQFFIHSSFILKFEKDLRFTIFSAPPELFFGTFRKNPIFYYVVYFFITTPLVYLLLFSFGTRAVLKKKTKIMLVLLVWFFLPFMQSFYPFRQQGIRYIIQIYAPFALIAAIGFESITTKLTKKFTIQFLWFMPILFIALFTLFRISPYYLDYFNLLTGGTKYVSTHHLFFQGWWGSGQKEAALYLEQHAKKHAKVGLVLNPDTTWKFSDNIQYSTYNKNKTYDYIVVNQYAITRSFFDPKPLLKKYKLVYSVLADGAPLVAIYQKK